MLWEGDGSTTRECYDDDDGYDHAICFRKREMRLLIGRVTTFLYLVVASVRVADGSGTEEKRRMSSECVC